MENLIELSKTELTLAFAASCIESVARRLSVPYREVYARLKRVGLVDRYILPCYDTLHTMSRENVTDDVIECLTQWENQQ